MKQPQQRLLCVSNKEVLVPIWQQVGIGGGRRNFEYQRLSSIVVMFNQGHVHKERIAGDIGAMVGIALHQWLR